MIWMEGVTLWFILTTEVLHESTWMVGNDESVPYATVIEETENYLGTAWSQDSESQPPLTLTAATVGDIVMALSRQYQGIIVNRQHIQILKNILNH
jgi:hypothetical protein